ncbi:16551_t:CDS:2 [Entrophospora sp. SA101]|nr:16551_t:CDS:2 [Entrophospora sp. SA101]
MYLFNDENVSDEISGVVTNEEEEKYGSVNLFINGHKVRDIINEWRKTSKHSIELHKQDLLNYNIIDTIKTSPTESRLLFKDNWDSIVNTIEDILSTPPVNDQSHIKDYMISLLGNTVRSLSACRKEKANIHTDEQWKKKPLKLVEIIKGRLKDQRLRSGKDETEYHYTINYISDIFNTLFKNDLRAKLLDFRWGEAHLKAASICNNHRLLDDQRRDHGNKIDLIIDLIDVPFEISIIEISGSPSEPDHTHYVGDRNKIAKMLKMMLNCIIIEYRSEIPTEIRMLHRDLPSFMQDLFIFR